MTLNNIYKIDPSNTGILLIGYNRPQLLANRLIELSNQQIKYLYLNIDGGRESHTKEMSEVIFLAQMLFSNLTLRVTHQKYNLGMAVHVTESITNLTRLHENIIVIEDDVKLSFNFIENLIKGLNFQKSIGLNGVVTGNSNLFIKNRKNKWRKVLAPSVWGWAISAQTWKFYNLYLNRSNIENEMANSKNFSKLSSYLKSFWKAKFYKSANDPYYNWDTQLRYALFKEDLESIAPIFSITGNEGFSSLNAKHTNYKMPRYLKNDKLNTSEINGLSYCSDLYNYLDFSGFKHRVKSYIKLSRLT